MSRFLAPCLQQLAPYVPGEQPQGRNMIKLNTNELPYAPHPAVVQAARQEAEKLNLYSDPGCMPFLQPLAAYLGLEETQVFAANGSDEVLAFCFEGLCPQGAAFADLTYGFYPVYASFYSVTAHVVPLRENFCLKPEDYVQLPGTLFIANPNAPTGLALAPEDIEVLLRQNANRLVVVDEAYVDFGTQSALPLLKKYDNLMVVGTFSKAWGLAGGRLGWAAASAEIIQDLNRIKFSFNPYNVNRMTLAAGAAALAQADYYRQCRRRVVQTRGECAKSLRDMGFEGPDSVANFLFVRHPHIPGKELYQQLRSRNILVRWFNKPRIQNHLRITVGTPAEMDALLAALEDIVQKQASTPLQ